MNFIKPKHNLLSEIKIHEYRTRVVKRIEELGLSQRNFKHDLEFLLLVCRLTEYVVQKGEGVDKKALVISIIQQLYGLNDEEKAKLEADIEFLWSNKRIKKLSFYQLFLAGVGELLKKR